MKIKANSTGTPPLSGAEAFARLLVATHAIAAAERAACAMVCDDLAKELEACPFERTSRI